MKTFLRFIAAALGLAMLLTGGPARSQSPAPTAWTPAPTPDTATAALPAPLPES
jgi:hypothetical protein